MDDHGNVCLTDFGMAKIVRDGETAKTFCGTPEYLAPEVLEGGGYDKTADWWSLGILTFEMMHGLPPFYNKSQSLMFKLIKEGEVKFSEKVKITPEAQDFLLRILNKNPKQRLGAQGDVEDILGHPWFKGMDREKMLKKEVLLSQLDFAPLQTENRRRRVAGGLRQGVHLRNRSLRRARGSQGVRAVQEDLREVLK